MMQGRWPALLAVTTVVLALGAPALAESMTDGAGSAAGASLQSAYSRASSGMPGPRAAGRRLTTRRLRAILAAEKGAQANRLAHAATLSPARVPPHAGAALRDAGPSLGTDITFPTLNYCGSPTCGNPPDGGFAVGPSSMLVAVNHRFAFYNRSGQMTLGPIDFYDFFGPPYGAYDPRAIYDAGNAASRGYNGGHGRFILLGLTNNKSAQTSSYLLAVSQNENPQSATSGWCIYRFNGAVISGTVSAEADFPDLGMDGQNLYITSEELSFSSSSFVMHRLLVLPKASVYPDATTGACPTATSTDFKPLLNPDGSLAYDVEPANQPDALPAQTTPMYLINALMNGGSHLVVRSVTLSPSPQLNPPSWVAVSSFDPPDNELQPSGNPISNSGTSLQDASYRYGAIYGANMTEHVSSSLSKSANPYANVQWYKVDPVALTAQSHGITNTTIAYFTPNIMAGCSTATTPGPGGVPQCAAPFTAVEVSGAGPSQPASAYYVLNGGNPVLFEAGVAGYSSGNNPNLWGDYPGVSADPTNASAVWLLGEYAQTTTGWGTAVTSLTPTPTTLSLAPSSGRAGSQTTVSGSGYGPNEEVQIKLYCSTPTCGSKTVLGTATTSSGGSFSQSVTIPSSTAVGGHSVGALGESSGDFAYRTFTVTP